MSATVQLFSEILGVANVQVRLVGWGFTTNPILAIGANTWASQNWNFHQFGWYDGSVYDACLELAPNNQTNNAYVPVHDDINGNCKINLGGNWNPETPFSIVNFD